MKKINMLYKVVIFIAITNVVLSQSVSLRDIERSSNRQLDEIRTELQNQQTNDPSLTSELSNQLENINVSSNAAVNENEELNYFVKHLDKKKPSIANGNHAFEVMKILVEASAKLQN